MLSIGIVALAGPSWQQSKLPLWSKNDPLVIVEDMSTAMLQTDVEPSRLDVARTKVAAVLKDWQGNVGMVAFAEQPFTVSPLTEDPQNVAVFLDPLLARRGRKPAHEEVQHPEVLGTSEAKQMVD